MRVDWRRRQSTDGSFQSKWWTVLGLLYPAKCIFHYVHFFNTDFRKVNDFKKKKRNILLYHKEANFPSLSLRVVIFFFLSSFEMVQTHRFLSKFYHKLSFTWLGNTCYIDFSSLDILNQMEEKQVGLMLLQWGYFNNKKTIVRDWESRSWDFTYKLLWNFKVYSPPPYSCTILPFLTSKRQQPVVQEISTLPF